MILTLLLLATIASSDPDLEPEPPAEVEEDKAEHRHELAEQVQRAEHLIAQLEEALEAREHEIEQIGADAARLVELLGGRAAESAAADKDTADPAVVRDLGGS